MSVETTEQTHDDSYQWADWLTRELLPRCLDFEEFDDVSERLRALPILNDWEPADRAWDLIGDLVPRKARSWAVADGVRTALIGAQVVDEANWRARCDAPAWLEAAGLERFAAQLRKLPPICTEPTATLAFDLITHIGVTALKDAPAPSLEPDGELACTAFDVAQQAMAAAHRVARTTARLLAMGPTGPRCLTLVGVHQAASAAADTFRVADEVLLRPGVALAQRGWRAPFDDFVRAVDVIDSLDWPTHSLALLCLLRLPASEGTAEQLAALFEEIERLR